MANYMIFLPPSEGKHKGGNEELPYKIVENTSKYNSFKELLLNRKIVYEQLLLATTKLNEEELEKLFELKNNNLFDAISQTQDMLNLPTMPSIKRYTGVMYNAIDYDNLSLNQKANFDENTIIIDGMFGLLRPQDYIPEYKLKITSKILDLDVTNFWKEELKPILDEIIKDKIVFDLLPQTHKKVLDLPKNSNKISIIFGELKNGELKQSGHFSKKLKGEFIQYITQKEEITTQYIKEFSHSQGYKYNHTLSDDSTFIFSKEI